MNSLQILVEKYPNKLCDWEEVSDNPNITWKIEEANPDKEWNRLSQNPNITCEIIEANPDNPRAWCYLSKPQHVVGIY